jgi:uncharacterized repeat protein (TIGR01451 family)
MCLLFSKAKSQQTATCLLTPGLANTEVSAALGATSIKTGMDFNLAISLPGLQGCGNYTVAIGTSNNIIQGSGNSYPQFSSGVGGNIDSFQNSVVIPSTNALNFGVSFKFKPGVTCNGEIGKFNITISIICGGVKKSCNLTVSIKAIAINTWSVKKQHIWGNLSGGNVLWRIMLVNSDNSGFGTYNIASGGITDNLSSGTIVSVTGNTYPVTYNGAVAFWGVGNISNTTSQVSYDVYTNSCSPDGTMIKNCASNTFTLGSQNCSIYAMNTSCDSVKLSNKPMLSTGFSKSLSYGVGNLNYAPGCEGEYTIQISNTGNVPLNAIQLSDQIPANINVTAIRIYSNGNANMNYSTTFPTTTGNTAISQTLSPLMLAYPNTFTFTTSSGMLLGETIFIKIRFTISGNAPIGSTIKNCANLNYGGTYGTWTNNCNTPLPPIPTATQIESCVSFKVESPKPIPGLSKSITTNNQTYNIGDDIPFRIVVSNHGQGNLSGYTLSDLLNTPQFLEINSPIKYGWGIGSFAPIFTGSSFTPMPTMGTIPPSWLAASNIALGSQNPNWVISGMPGNCHLDSASYLVIEFKAKIRPGAWGNYTNTSKLTIGATSLFSSTPYNITRIGKLDIDKYVNSGSGTGYNNLAYVDPGQPFSFQLVITNAGSVSIKDIDIQDVLPSCVTANGSPTGIIKRTDGTSTTIAVTAAPALNFSPAVTIAPGDSIIVTINVIRNSNDNSPECCNPGATVNGKAVDNLMNVYSISGQACVKSSLCCTIKDFKADLTINYNNNQITPTFLLTSNSSAPIQEINISLVDYHVEYNNTLCKPLNMGNLSGHIQPTIATDAYNTYNYNRLPPIGNPALTLQTTVNPNNSSLTWKGQTPINISGSWNFNGLIAINFTSPDVLNLDCCSGRVYFCFKVTVKDVNCNVCEKIVCGSAVSPKPLLTPGWVNGNQKKIFEQ